MVLSLSYEHVDAVTMQNDAVVGAAEAHGLLTGMLCIHEGIDQRAWLGLIFGEAADALGAEALSLLSDLSTQTLQALQDENFGFDLFLPDDDVALRFRAIALSEWCQGFLAGLGHEISAGDWPGECGEILHDLVEISKLSYEGCDESDEEAFMEVSEFVRIGVQVIRGEFQSQKQRHRLH